MQVFLHWWSSFVVFLRGRFNPFIHELWEPWPRILPVGTSAAYREQLWNCCQLYIKGSIHLCSVHLRMRCSIKGHCTPVISWAAQFKREDSVTVLNPAGMNEGVESCCAWPCVSEWKMSRKHYIPVTFAGRWIQCAIKTLHRWKRSRFSKSPSINYFSGFKKSTEGYKMVNCGIWPVNICHAVRHRPLNSNLIGRSLMIP